MKKSLVYSLRGLLALLAISFAISSASAEEKKKKEPKPPSATDLAKYDTNKDGTLDKAENAKLMADKKAATAASSSTKTE